MPTSPLKKQVRKVRALVEACGSLWKPVEACGSLWKLVEARGTDMDTIFYK